MEHGDMTAGGASAFDVVLRGYDRRQVDDHLAGMEQRLSATATQASELRGQRDSAAGRVRELEGGASPTGTASGGASGLDGFGAHVESILRVASEEAAAIRRRAEDSVRHHAEAQDKLRATFQGIAERLEPLVARLDEESSAARTAHADIGAETAALHKSAQEQADALVAAVEAATSRMQADATTRIEVTARQSADVREELALVRQVLTNLGSGQRATPAPATAPAQPVGLSKAAAPSPTGVGRAGPRITVGAVAGGGSNDATGPVPVVTADEVRPQRRLDHGDAPTETISLPAGAGNGTYPGTSGRDGSGNTGR